MTSFEIYNLNLSTADVINIVLEELALLHLATGPTGPRGPTGAGITNGLPTGSVTGPSLFFTSAPDVGLYLAATGTLGIASEGTEVLVCNADVIETNVPLQIPNGYAAAPSLQIGSSVDTGLFSNGPNVDPSLTLGLEGSPILQIRNTLLQSEAPMTVPIGSATGPALGVGAQPNGLYQDWNPTFTSISAAGTNQWRGIAWSPSLRRVVATAVDGTNRMMYSDDAGTTWTSIANDGGQWSCIVWAETIGYVALGYDGNASVSDDGLVWTPSSGVGGCVWESVAFSPTLGRLVAVASDGPVRCAYSSDGLAWTTTTTANDALNYYNILWIEEHQRFLIAPDNFAVQSSPDGITWTVTSSAGYLYPRLAYAPALHRVILVGDTTAEFSFSDDGGMTWSLSGTSTTAMDAVVWASSLQRFVAFNTGSLRYSLDGRTWTSFESVSDSFSYALWIPEWGRILATYSTSESTLLQMGNANVMVSIDGSPTLEFYPTQTVSNVPLYLPTPGGTASPLNVYETVNLNGTWNVNGGGSASPSGTVYITQIGRMVHLSLRGCTTGAVVDPVTSIALTNLPARFQPTTSTGGIVCQIQETDALTIATWDGTYWRISGTLSGGAFSGSASYTIRDFTISYAI